MAARGWRGRGGAGGVGGFGAAGSGYGGLLKSALQSVRWANAVGFGLCQTWNILCVALRDPVTYGEPFIDLRWLSLAVACAASVVLVLAQGRATDWLRSGRAFAGIGVLAAASSILGPVSAAVPVWSSALIHCAAVGVGLGFTGLFAAWYLRFYDARDMAGLACSVAACVLSTYPLANVLASDQVSPWLSAAVGSALPLVSVVLARWGGGKSTGADGVARERLNDGAPMGFAALPIARRVQCVRFASCLLVVVAAIETVRNLLLGGTALTFYAGVANLGGATLKMACAAWLVCVFKARDARGVSLAYRVAFLLMLGVVLWSPFLFQGNWFAHMLLDVGSFFFQLIALMVAYQLCFGFKLPPLATFGTLRAVWAAGALAGIAAERAIDWGGPGDAGRLLAAVLGLAVAAAFTFVFTDRDCVKVLASVPAEAYAPRFRTQCARLARRCGVSDRELEVMVLTAKGRSSARIAEDLGVAPATVNTHVHHIYQKLGVHSRQELMDLIEREDPRSKG